MALTNDAADLLSDFKFFANRTENDASLTDAQIYRVLDLGLQQVWTSFVSLFPRFAMQVPVLMVRSTLASTYGGGTVFRIDGTDNNEVNGFIIPWGSAEVYATLPNGQEMYGSTYAGGDGDFVFSGGNVIVPGSGTRTFSSGPYIRYNRVPIAVSSAGANFSLPAFARQLVVFRALVLWANRGGLRDPSGYEEMYTQAWSGNPNRIGDVGVLGAMTTQYARSMDGAKAGIRWWRWAATQGALPVGAV